jgi:hypothetical protein
LPKVKRTEKVKKFGKLGLPSRLTVKSRRRR